jgi:hypothetical protein
VATLNTYDCAARIVYIISAKFLEPTKNKFKKIVQDKNLLDNFNTINFKTRTIPEIRVSRCSSVTHSPHCPMTQ